MTDEVAEGHVVVREARVASRRTEEGILLFHVPTSRIIRLDPPAEALWQHLTEGVTDVAELVRRHSKEAGIPLETASYHVLAFLDVLQDVELVEYELVGGKRNTPLVDVRLDVPGQLVFEPTRSGGTRPEDVEIAGRLTVNRPDLTIREAIEAAAEANGLDAEAAIGQRPRIVALDLEPHELGTLTLQHLAARRVADDSARERRLVRPELGMTMADVIELQDTTPGLAARRRAARAIGILICRNGVCILIIIVIAEPTWGKSRNACKSVCV